MAAKIYISEYVRLRPVNLGMVFPGGEEPCVAEQLLNTTGTSAQSAAFNTKTNFIRVQVDGVVSIKFGASPTAVTTAKRLAANTVEYFAVQPGDKLAGIDNT